MDTKEFSFSADGAFYDAEELRERLSISTYVFRGYRPLGQRALEELAASGITRIELTESPEQYDIANVRSMRLMGELFRSSGIEVVAYHVAGMSFSDLDTEAKRTERVDCCRRQIDTMLDIGGVIWCSHAQVADPTLVRCYEELAQYVENTEALIAVENFAPSGMWVEDRVAFLDQLDHPQVGMVLDIGHVRNTEGANPMTIPGGPTQVLDTCAHRLIHLHLHGFKNGKDHYPPFVEGDSIQWTELFRMLRATGYRGPFNFEPSGEPKHHNAVQATASAPERIVEMNAQPR